MSDFRELLETILMRPADRIEKQNANKPQEKTDWSNVGQGWRGPEYAAAEKRAADAQAFREGFGGQQRPQAPQAAGLGSGRPGPRSLGPPGATMPGGGSPARATPGALGSPVVGNQPTAPTKYWEMGPDGMPHALVPMREMPLEEKRAYVEALSQVQGEVRYPGGPAIPPQ